MKLYRVIVSLDVEANDEDDACRVAERECSSAFNSCESVRVLVSYDEDKHHAIGSAHE